MTDGKKREECQNPANISHQTSRLKIQTDSVPAHGTRCERNNKNSVKTRVFVNVKCQVVYINHVD